MAIPFWALTTCAFMIGACAGALFMAVAAMGRTE